jgi:hypothetical protein
LCRLLFFVFAAAGWFFSWVKFNDRQVDRSLRDGAHEDDIRKVRLNFLATVLSALCFVIWARSIDKGEFGLFGSSVRISPFLLAYIPVTLFDFAWGVVCPFVRRSKTYTIWVVSNLYALAITFAVCGGYSIIARYFAISKGWPAAEFLILASIIWMYWIDISQSLENRMRLNVFWKAYLWPIDFGRRLLDRADPRVA